MSRRVKRLALASVLLAAFPASGLLRPATTHAAVSTCRSDPVVWLSNKMKVQVTATVQTDMSHILSVHYVIRIPAGVSVSHVVYTQGRMKHLERLDVLADNVAGAYDTVLVATAQSSTIPVEAETSAADQTTGWKGNATVTGLTNQDLMSHLSN